MIPDRIVILNDRSAAKGGATGLALLSARLFHAAGIPITYITGDSGEGAELPTGVECIALGGAALLDQPFGQRVVGGLFNARARALVADAIARLDTPRTVYHLHGWAQILSPAVFRALAPVEERLVVHSHDFALVCPTISYFNFQTETVCTLKPLSAACLATHCDKRGRADKAFRSTRSFLKNRLFDLARTRSLIVPIHPSMEPWLARGGVAEARMRTVRNPVAPFTSTRVPAEDNETLFFIGRVSSEKGVDLAAEAARAAGRRLCVIGDGEDRERLARAYPEIEWAGWRQHHEISGLIQSARGLIMPSRLPEPFGLVALEALQSGIPLVAYGDSFVAAEAAELGAAFVAHSRRPGALADATRRLDDNEAMRRASEAGFGPCRTLSNTHDSWRDGLLALYSELLSPVSPVQPGAPCAADT